MKNSSLSTKLILAAVFLAVLLYFGYSISSYLMAPYHTSVAYSFTSEHAVTVSGYVVRQEEVLPGGGELVYSARGEGERVSAGGTVAQIYQSTQALDDANLLRSLEEQLEQLRYARGLATGAQSSARLDDEIRESLLGFRQALAGGSPSAVADRGGALRSSVLKRSYATSGTGDLEESIASLQERISALSTSAGAGTVQVTAPGAGLFSSLVDGYESVLTLEAALSMTPKDYRAIAPEAGTSGVGKMVYGSRWAFLTLMRAEDVSRLAEGDKVTLRFQTGLERDLEMEVGHISVEQDGMRTVAFTSEKFLSLTTLLRHQNAQIIFNSYSGIRVPRSSVRVDQAGIVDEEGDPVLDSSGQQKTEPVTCVYCMWGEFARRKPVRVLWQEEEYILVAPDEEALGAISAESTRESRRLRSGDAVIISAAEIYDGMVIR